MSPETLFRMHLAFGYVAWLLCFGAYIWPRLKSMDRVEAHRAIATLHSFRFFGLQQVPMKLDHVCRVGKGARAPVVRVTCKLDCARRAHAVGCQWWARRAKRAFAHPTIHFERNAL
jgi:hypothetical protein